MLLNFDRAHKEKEVRQRMQVTDLTDLMDVEGTSKKEQGKW